MQTLKLFGIYTLGIFCLLANCIAEPIAIHSNKYHLVRTNMENAADEIRALSNEKLWQQLCETKYDVQLSEVSTKAPESWVSRTSTLMFLHELC